MDPLVLHWIATDRAHQNRRSASRKNAPDHGQEIVSAVDNMVRKKTLSFVCILERKYFGLRIASPLVICSEWSPLFRTIILSYLQNRIGWGIPLRLFPRKWLVDPTWSHQWPPSLRSLVCSGSDFHPFLHHLLCSCDPRACAWTISLCHFCSCYIISMFLCWLNLVGHYPVLWETPEALEGYSWCIMAPCSLIWFRQARRLSCVPPLVEQ